MAAADDDDALCFGCFDTVLVELPGIESDTVDNDDDVVVGDDDAAASHPRRTFSQRTRPNKVV